MSAGVGLHPCRLTAVTGLPCYVLPLTGLTRPPLSLNDRGRTKGAMMAKARKTRHLRDLVVVAGRAAGVEPWPYLHVVLHYVPRDRRARDRDNLVATLKPCIDALTAAGQDRGRACLGMVPDDTGDHVGWSAPVIHEPDGEPRLWLTVQACSGPPPMG